MSRDRYSYIQSGARLYQWQAFTAWLFKAVYVIFIAGLGVMFAAAAAFGN